MLSNQSTFELQRTCESVWVVQEIWGKVLIEVYSPHSERKRVVLWGTMSRSGEETDWQTVHFQ